MMVEKLRIMVNGTVLLEMDGDAKRLFLFCKDIERITDIEGIDAIPGLEELFLAGNKITHIEGLDRFIHLRSLWLNSNRIKRIEGLEKLVNLRELSSHSEFN